MNRKRSGDGRFVYEELPGGCARLLRCLGEESEWRLPERIEGLWLTEAAPYLFSAQIPQEPMSGGIAACGEGIEAVYFPETLRVLGRYAFYNCGGLRGLGLPGALSDLGGGAFNGCRTIRDLTVTEPQSGRSCLKELLFELNETVRVHYRRPGQTEDLAVLLFPEYYEEAVENTPARILETRMHGVGHRYRYCFQDTKLNFREYDSEELFYELTVQESPGTVAELALGRLRFPYECRDEAKRRYEDYVKGQIREAAEWALGQGEDFFRWFVRYPAWGREEFAQIMEAANREGRPDKISRVMEEQRRRFSVGRKTFTF